MWSLDAALIEAIRKAEGSGYTQHEIIAELEKAIKRLVDADPTWND